MPAPAPITVWHWVGFIAVVVVCLVLDLGVFQRANKPVKPKHALIRSGLWLALALVFAGVLKFWRGADDSLEFITGYFVEFSLSLDNVVAIALIFSSFGVAGQQQHRVLFWGVLGAIVMRGIMIGAGAALIERFHWILFVFGGFLIFVGAKWAFTKPSEPDLKQNPLLRFARKILPISEKFNGQHFFARENGRRLLTPLILVLLAVEVTDLVFALDSVPAVFAITQKAFIVFTSNIFAILGLRSLYFAAAGAIQSFCYLKTGLAVVLLFVGTKMLAAPWYNVRTGWSLVVIAAIIAVAIGLSIRRRRQISRP